MNKPYTKSMQLMKNRINKKPSAKNKPKITQDEKDYLNWLDENRSCLSCIVCGTFKNIHFHHVKNKSTDKKNHTRLIPVCNFHHLGNELSPHGTPKKWREVYPIQNQYQIADELYQRYLVLKDIE